jgi:quercetin dioxygenase-like cupin family protein
MGNTEESVRCVRTLVDIEGARVAEFEMAPGAQGPRHYHSSLCEHCICLQGQLDVKIDGSSTRLLQPGDRAEIGPGVGHQVGNPGSEPGRYLVVQFGGAHDFVEL